MSVWVRRGLWLLSALILLLAAAGTWLVATFDADRYKGLAVEWVKTHRDRTLAINGPLELSLLPRLAVKLSDVHLSEKGRPDEFIALERAGLSIELLPLLRGEWVIGRVEAQGVRASYRRSSPGDSNVDDLLQPPGAAKAGDKTLRFDINGVDLADVRLHLKDDTLGLDGELQLKSLSAGRLGHLHETPVKLVASLDFKSPAMKGELSGGMGLTLDLDTGSASAKGMDLTFKGEAPGASAVDARLTGALAWDGNARAVEARSLALKLDATAGSVQLAESMLTLKFFSFDAARRSAKLDTLHARLKGTHGGRPLTLDFDCPVLNTEGSRLSGSAFSGKLMLAGNLPLDARFKSGAPSGSLDELRLPGFETHITSDTAERKIAGSLRGDLALRPREASLAFQPLELQAKIQQPQLPTLALSARGQVRASTRRSTWDLGGQLDSNRFDTDGSLTLGAGVPHLQLQARFDTLDLNRTLGPPPTATAKAAATAADTPIDLNALHHVNGQFKLRAGSFAHGHYRVKDGQLEATLDAGTLRATRIEGKAWDGTLAFTAFADARAGRVALKGVASDVNVNKLLKDVVQKDGLEGTGRVTLDLDSTGRSTQEMKSRLHGNAALQLRDGAFKGINLAKTVRQAKAALAARHDTRQASVQTEKTDFSELEASFQLADGVAHNQDLVVKSPFLRVGGQGTIDIGKGRLDYLARATIIDTATGQGGDDLAGLRGVTVPVQVSGPFDAPDWKISWTAVAVDAVTNRLKDKLGARPPADGASGLTPEQALKKRLKDIFK